MTVNTIESTANCNVEEAQEWLTCSLNDALSIPGNREAQVVISYLEEDGQLNVITGQLDSSDGSWDCQTQSHVYHPGAGEMQSTMHPVDWDLKKFDQLAEQVRQMVEDIVPVSDRASEHDPEIDRPSDDDEDE